MINLILSFRKPYPEVETDANSGMTLLASDCPFRAFSGEEVWRRSAGFRSTWWKNSHRNSCCFPAGACDWQGKGFLSDAPNQIGSKRTELQRQLSRKSGTVRLSKRPLTTEKSVIHLCHQTPHAFLINHLFLRNPSSAECAAC